jgi:probable F420-dependent oxidoreductase
MWAAALWTTTLRVAAHMYCNDFRHPALVANEAATVATLTEGRFDVGIGAGWMATDYERTGIPFDPPGHRIDRLREAVRIIRDTWRGGPVSRSGPAYTVTGLPGWRRPPGVPVPALMMGGGGRRMLTLAAEEADIVSINVRLESGRLGPERGATATAEATREKVAVVREAAGDRWAGLELQIEEHVVEITDDRAAALELASATVGLPVDEAARSPHVLVGSVDEVCERLQAMRSELGTSYICLSGDSARQFAPVVERLAGA